MNVYYKEINNEIDIFKKSFVNKIPIMLKGPTGCGKSRFVEKMAFILNLPLIQVACNEETSAIDLQGRYIIKSGETIWQNGPATTAAINGYLLYLDEISEAREDVIVVIHPLTDHRRELYLDKKNEKIVAHNNFMLVASYNPGYQNKVKDLKISTKQRFITLNFDYPDEINELEILINETKIDLNTAKKLISYAKKLRNLKDLQLLETISTRLLINTAKMIVTGLNIYVACDIGIINVLSDDIDVQLSLKDILRLYV